MRDREQMKETVRDGVDQNESAIGVDTRPTHDEQIEETHGMHQRQMQFQSRPCQAVIGRPLHRQLGLIEITSVLIKI